MVQNDRERFIEYLRFEKRSSAHTVIAYETDLIQFADFLATQYQSTDLTERISKEKYPEYGKYQKHVSRIIPFLPGYTPK